MSTNTALIFDFNRPSAPRRAPAPASRVDLGEALANIARTAQWLAEHQVCVIGFVASTLHDPVLIVAAHPAVWRLFAGRVTSPGHCRNGALRYDVHECEDRINRVTVRWQEVSACA